MGDSLPGRVNTGLTESQIRAEILKLSQRDGVGTKNIEMYPQLARALKSAYGARATLRDSLHDAVRNLGRKGIVQSPDGSRESAGEEWAAVLIMMLNLTGVHQNLGQRQAQFSLPTGLAKTYNMFSSGSSRFRSTVCPDAAAVLARELATVQAHGVESNVSSGATLVGRIEAAIRRQIDVHSYAEGEWTSALSGQYFLILLGRLLSETDRFDYRELVDTFMASFNPRSDDTLVLDENNVLVTPHELEQIRARMKSEDEADPYFTRVARTRSESIDTDLLHKNYLYGLILGMSARRGSRMMSLVNDIALAHLSGVGSESQDVAGGWKPYRIPWITARILLSMREVDAPGRSPQLDGILRSACESLMARMLPTGTWRSGVGDWVTGWESTGLCLEALLAWPEYCPRERLAESLDSVWQSRVEWMTDPDLSTAAAANDLLAAVILCSSLANASEIPEVRTAAAEYLESALKQAETVALPQTRQYCTVPQIIYYSAKALRG